MEDQTIPERVLIIKGLIRHPSGVGERWTINLANELIDIAEQLIRQLPKEEDNG
jgi:hypothetical protein